jgi:hypothetical protein
VFLLLLCLLVLVLVLVHAVLSAVCAPHTNSRDENLRTEWWLQRQRGSVITSRQECARAMLPTASCFSHLN